MLTNSEAGRIAKLHEYAVLDTEAEASFDRITRVAARSIDVPICLISLVDEDRQWFKSSWGLEARQTPRDWAFCDFTIRSDEVFVVSNAAKDSRFKDTPLVTGPPHIRFYAGAPLLTQEGFRLGALCVIDTKPRRLSKRNRELLADLAALVMDELELRFSRRTAAETSVKFHAETKRARDSEKALRLSEARRKRESTLLEDVERLSGTGAWQVDLESGELFWSAETRRIHEVDEEFEPNIETAIDFYLPDDRPTISDAVERAMKNGTPWDLELSIRSAKGAVKLVRATGEVLFEDGDAKLLRGSFQDITARNAAEKALNAARIEADRANAAKSQFLANISHEIRTPLNAIIGFADSLRLGIGMDDPGKRAETLEIISTAGRGLNTLLADIVDYSRIETDTLDMTFETVVPNALLEEKRPLFEQILNGYSLSLPMHPGGDSGIRVDKARLVQILLNFVTNSAKYNKPGGSVEIACSAVGDNTARISVTDTGIGISADKLHTLFTPFSRGRETSQDIPGVGLGLSISKRLTEEMGGTIGYHSTQGVGSTFWVEFPYCD